MNNSELIDGLYGLMCTATSSVSDSRVENNDYFKRRVLGFRAEIEFEELINEMPGSVFLEGGQFISKKITGNEDDKNKFIYTTISSDDPEKYLTLYETISSWDEVDLLVYIKINENNWQYVDLLVKEASGGDPTIKKILKPNFSFFRFDSVNLAFEEIDDEFSVILDRFDENSRRPSIFPLRKREQFDYFEQYSTNVLSKIYATRYFLDVVLRKASGRQIIDLDGFIMKPSGSLVLVEVKEKSPIMNNSLDKMTWQYGWDSRRILWYLYLLKNIQMSALYCVRQINNRDERKFVQWDTIFIEDFLHGVSWSNSRAGGGGEDTLLAPYSFFRRIEQNLE